MMLIFLFFFLLAAPASALVPCYEDPDIALCMGDYRHDLDYCSFNGTEVEGSRTAVGSGSAINAACWCHTARAKKECLTDGCYWVHLTEADNEFFSDCAAARYQDAVSGMSCEFANRWSDFKLTWKEALCPDDATTICPAGDEHCDACVGYVDNDTGHWKAKSWCRCIVGNGENHLNCPDKECCGEQGTCSGLTSTGHGQCLNIYGEIEECGMPFKAGGKVTDSCNDPEHYERLMMCGLNDPTKSGDDDEYGISWIDDCAFDGRCAHEDGWHGHHCKGDSVIHEAPKTPCEMGEH